MILQVNVNTSLEVISVAVRGDTFKCVVQNLQYTLKNDAWIGQSEGKFCQIMD